MSLIDASDSLTKELIELDTKYRRLTDSLANSKLGNKKIKEIREQIKRVVINLKTINETIAKGENNK